MPTELTIPEALALIDPQRSHATTCLQGALLALVGKGVVGLSGDVATGLRVHLKKPRALSSPLLEVDAALRSEGAAEELDWACLLYRLQRRFGADYGRYFARHVAPSLRQRGLLEAHEVRRWWGGRALVWQPTPAAGAVRAALKARVEALDVLPSLLKSAPQEAVLLALRAGPLLLASTTGRAALPQLREHAAALATSATIADAIPRTRAELEALLDLGTDLLELEWLSLFEAVADVLTLLATEAVDYGDGGGGDGGD